VFFGVLLGEPREVGEEGGHFVHFEAGLGVLVVCQADLGMG
jgi:hypothetical protein